MRAEMADFLKSVSTPFKTRLQLWKKWPLYAHYTWNANLKLKISKSASFSVISRTFLAVFPLDWPLKLEKCESENSWVSTFDKVTMGIWTESLFSLYHASFLWKESCCRRPCAFRNWFSFREMVLFKTFMDLLCVASLIDIYKIYSAVS